MMPRRLPGDWLSRRCATCQRVASILRGVRPRRLWVICVLVVAVGGGCSRRFYRERADREADQVIAEKAGDPRWAIGDFELAPDPRSRFYDPYCADEPPQPPDDPAAEMLAPRPQWASTELPVPHESDAYLELLPIAPVAEAAWGDVRPVAFEFGGSALRSDPLLEIGLPVRVLNARNSFEVALINSRDYQERKESLFLSALDVTLERFAFAPQFFVTQQTFYEHIGRELEGGAHELFPGADPEDVRPNHVGTDPRFSSEVDGNRVLPGETPSSESLDGQFTESFVGREPQPGSSIGVGKLFTNGGALLLRFANNTVWEFTGPLKGHISQSAITLDFVQPLLQGGGRAVTMEPLTQAERNLLYEIRRYARFQREFYVSVMTGADIDQALRLEQAQESDQDLEGQRRRVGLLPLVEQLQVLANEQQNLELLEAYERQFAAFHRAGEVSLIQLDQVRQDVAAARSRVLRAQQRYFTNLDRFKLQLGLPTHLPLVVDEQLLELFRLDTRQCRLPNLPNALPDVPYRLNEALDLAMQNRLDLMSARASLVDHWRKIAVAANGLLGVLDIEYHGEWYTPDPLAADPLDPFNPSSQPLDFGTKRSQHRAVLKTELPIVRKRERNTYRATLIEYQIARRTLMEIEDVVRLEVLDAYRRLVRARQDFAIQRGSVILACRRVDQSRKLLELPPPPGEERQFGPTAARDLLEAQRDLVEAQNKLVEVWVDYKSAQLELLRDLELLEIDAPDAMSEDIFGRLLPDDSTQP